MPDEHSPLDVALAELAVLGTDHDRLQLAALRGRLAAGRLRVVVAGESQRGKSTLINALLGQAVLPTGVTPRTTVVTTVRHGADPHADVRFLDGRHEQRQIAELPGLVTGRGNPGNRWRVGSVTVYTDAPVLLAGAELVDTPGTGSVLERGCSQTARQVLETADAAVVVLAADPPVSAREMDLLSTVMNVAVAAFVVLNKADYLTPAQLAEAGEFTRFVLSMAATRADACAGHRGSCRAAGTGGDPGRVYPMSARAAILGGDPGFAAFAADFTHYLAARHMADLTRSASAQARRITTALLGEARAARRQSREHAARLSGRVERFTTRLGRSPVSAKDVVTIVDGERVRMLFALNDATTADAPLLRRGIASRLEATFSDELRAASATEIDRLGGQRLASFTQEAVSGWRCQQQARVEQGLAALEQRLRTELAGTIGAVRTSATELLGLYLAGPETDRQAAADRQFPERTVAADPPGPVLRPGYRVLPGEPGRRRARQHLRDQIPDLTAACLEEASAAVQHELTQLCRILARAMEQRYADAGESIRAAQRTAAELGERAAAEASRMDSTLDKQEQALRRVASLLLRAGGLGADPVPGPGRAGLTAGGRIARLSRGDGARPERGGSR